LSVDRVGDRTCRRWQEQFHQETIDVAVIFKALWTAIPLDRLSEF
jgi:hypothetical protein